MDGETFDTRLELVRNKITKENTVMRDTITVKERLTATLGLLATANTYV